MPKLFLSLPKSRSHPFNPFEQNSMNFVCTSNSSVGIYEAYFVRRSRKKGVLFRNCNTIIDFPCFLFSAVRVSAHLKYRFSGYIRQTKFCRQNRCFCETMIWTDSYITNIQCIPEFNHARVCVKPLIVYPFRLVLIWRVCYFVMLLEAYRAFCEMHTYRVFGRMRYVEASGTICNIITVHKSMEGLIFFFVFVYYYYSSLSLCRSYFYKKNILI